jgi:hypothetical protein
VNGLEEDVYNIDGPFLVMESYEGKVLKLVAIFDISEHTLVKKIFRCLQRYF